MKIGIDISAMGEPDFTGIGVYVENLIKNLAEIDRENEYYLCYRFSRLKYKWIENPVRQDNFRLKIIQEPFNFFFQRKLDVFHGPAERLPDYSQPKKVVTIHDMAAIKGGDFMTDGFREMVKARYRELILGGKADVIVTVSQSTKWDICDYYKIDPLKVRVVYEGVKEVFRSKPKEEVDEALERLGIKKPYILNVGAQQERKNIVRLLHAYRKYIEGGGKADLVLSGKPTYGYEKIPKTISLLGIEGRVTIIGHVPMEDLVSLYSGALMFCFPSLYEGFGLPLVEAFACGCPVITSNVTSMPEVAGDAAVIVDPYKVEEIEAAMHRLSKEKEREKLIGKGLERARFFNWKKTAEGVLEIYKSLA